MVSAVQGGSVGRKALSAIDLTILLNPRIAKGENYAKETANFNNSLERYHLDRNSVDNPV